MKKHKIITILIVIILIFSLSLFLVACNGGDNSGNESSNENEGSNGSGNIEGNGVIGHTHSWTFTCEESGHVQKCSACKQTNAKASHNVVSGKCSICNYIVETKTLAYQESADGTYYIVVGIEIDYDNIDSLYIKYCRVPATYNGKPVLAIGVDENTSQGQFEEIVLPEGMLRIEENAFLNQTYLKKIALPNSIESIGVNVFDGCEKLTTITFLGSESEWSAISKEGCGIPANCVIKFNN